MTCIICCFQGVAPTILPVFRSCKLSPPIAAAQHTTAPTKMAAAAPDSLPNKARINKEVNRIVAIVTPDIGLLDEPTTPAIYAATAENKNPKIHIVNDKITAAPQDGITLK